MSSIARARPGANLLPALYLAPAGSPSESAPSAAPGASPAPAPVGGWKVSDTGDAQASLELVDGELSRRP